MIGAYNLKNLSLIEWGPEYAIVIINLETRA